MRIAHAYVSMYLFVFPFLLCKYNNLDKTQSI